jgi:acetyl-CoA carboxylase/biotin carboxylase 1
MTEIAGNCSLSSYGTASRILHVVAPAPGGPFLPPKRLLIELQRSAHGPLPRHMLAGAPGPSGEFLPGFFDRGSFTETLAAWGKTVVAGRARLGGIPMGVIAVETRLQARSLNPKP